MLRNFRLITRTLYKYPVRPNSSPHSFTQPRRYSRFSASTIMSGHNFFSFDNYDCIGFDLDNTICRFNIEHLMNLEYDILSNYLVENKGYDPVYLLEPMSQNADFLQRGLIMDLERGNILRTGADGTILKASHGNNLLTEEDIIKYYGPNKQWEIANKYAQNPLVAWNSDLETKIRSCLDFFDIPATLCFANCVDSIDAKKGLQTSYNIWPDIFQGLQNMFLRDNFIKNVGGFYPKLKANPDKYYNKCDESVLSWLKNIKKHKTTFLITGSNVDFASYSARNCLGNDWMDYFDVIIFYARKPGFFTGSREFVGIDGLVETDPIVIDYSNKKHIYSRGNWEELIDLLSHISGKEPPKTLYIGDNLVQDIYTPSKFVNCDTVALLEEVSAEGMIGNFTKDPNSPILTSRMWGSLFSITDRNGQDIPTLWSDIIKRHSKLCIPSLKVIASQPLDHKYKTFSEDGTSSGFYPSDPINFVY
ncbi:5'-nucleotidase domain-containing protein 1-like [Arctopsyche grandis]|uniref:5'-nucleotidase domain-containing protein 1-like n=1 Tax=Arctopsyche grandis TaxID=121162 RepID=UPI00406D64A9